MVRTLRAVPTAPGIEPLPPPPPVPPRIVAPSRADMAFIGTLSAIGAVLATRLLLLLAIAGAFSLAVMAIRDGSWQSVGVVIAFAVLVVLPVTGIEIKQLLRTR